MRNTHKLGQVLSDGTKLSCWRCPAIICSWSELKSSKVTWWLLTRPDNSACNSKTLLWFKPFLVDISTVSINFHQMPEANPSAKRWRHEEESASYTKSYHFELSLFQWISSTSWQSGLRRQIVFFQSLLINDFLSALLKWRNILVEEIISWFLNGCI